jgi:hypothetical protein
LNEPGYKLFLFLKDGYQPGQWNSVLEMVVSEASQKGIKGFLVTNLEIQRNDADFFPRLFPLRADGTAIKTAARYNPTLFLINGGTIVQKWSAVDFEHALKTIDQLPQQ